MTKNEVLDRIATVNDDTAYTWCLAACSAINKLKLEGRNVRTSPIRFMELKNKYMTGRYNHVRAIQNELRRQGFDVKINMQDYELVLHNAE